MASWFVRSTLDQAKDTVVFFYFMGGHLNLTVLLSTQVHKLVPSNLCLGNPVIDWHLIRGEGRDRRTPSRVMLQKLSCRF